MSMASATSTQTLESRRSTKLVAQSNSVLSVDSTEPQEEIRLRLGAQEIADCFVQTNIANKVTHQADYARPYRVTVTGFYRELHALNGSIVFSAGSRDQLQNVSGNMNVSKGCDVSTDPRRAEYCCALRLRAPRGQYIALEITELAGFRIRLHDTSWVRVLHEDFKVAKDSVAYTVLFLGSSNVVNILLTVRLDSDRSQDDPEILRFVLRFQALQNRPGLQVKRSTFNRGVVQTPLHLGQTFLLNPLLNTWARVSAHPDHMIMISIPDFELMTMCVSLYAGDRRNETLASMCPSGRLPRPAIYNTSSLLVHATRSTTVFNVGMMLSPDSGAGFQIRFSFHNQSAPPELLADDSWNCSTSSRSALLHHLVCNLEPECHDAADECECSYTSDWCGPGYVTVGTSCMFYMRRTERKISWNMASDVCRRKGGRLAVLNSVEMWREVMMMIPISALHGVGFYIGLRSMLTSHLPLWYTYGFQWIDATTAFYRYLDSYLALDCNRMCGRIQKENFRSYLLLTLTSTWKSSSNVLCEKPVTRESIGSIILINSTNRWRRPSGYATCPLGHYTHESLACDVETSCWSLGQLSRCKSSLVPLPPSFTCTNQLEHVPYTLVCDYRADCSDDSDEDFCMFFPCRPGQFSCDNKQCISSSELCDGWKHCLGGADETECERVDMLKNSERTVEPPALVNISHAGRLEVYPLETARSTSDGGICPKTHFQCPPDGFCLPLLLRCNGLYDCPGRQDETGCDTCPGFYRCRASLVCVHHNYLCDGHAHCPQFDDELMCDTICPHLCTCRGLAFFCRHLFKASAHPQLRFVDARGSRMTPALFTGIPFLVYLNLAKCGLTLLDEFLLPNLRFLDIQDNQLSSLKFDRLAGAPQLRELSAAGNPLVELLGGVQSRSFSYIHKLDISRALIRVLNVTLLSVFPNLHMLNLSHSRVERVQGEGFRVTEQLRVIDLRGCPMTWFPRGMFQGLSRLQTIHAHNFRVCCPTLLPPHFNLRNCFAPTNEISSCADLLRENEYKTGVIILSFLAMVGNAVSFIFRACVSKREKLGYGNFVTHLSVSDFLMGVYLAIIGVADQVYHGTYLWNDVTWRHSVVCQFAGFLALLSCETSALVMCFITIDRFLVLRFPFSHLHFSSRSAHFTSVLVWVLGIVLSSVPLLPMTAHWEFYSQTGICIPLPITRSDFAGYDYSFSILVVFNFVVFVFISLGQLSIYLSVRANSMTVSNTTKKTKDLTIARRLITVALTDFLCWFPVGVLGLLASNGFPILGEINVAVAIFVLPLNSAVNPCLYTLNVILERRRRAREEKFRALLLAKLKALN